jgi:undecaprenyl-diphosphatase
MLRWVVSKLIQLEEYIGGRYAPEVYRREGQSSLKQIFILISHPILFVVFVCVAEFVAFTRIGEKVLWVGVGSVLISLLVNLLLKAIFKRGRPLCGDYMTPLPFDHYSFPSAHSAISFAFAAGVGIVDTGMLGLLLLWACLVSISRLLSEMHYSIDILVGILEGILLGTILSVLTLKLCV